MVNNYPHEVQCSRCHATVNISNAEFEKCQQFPARLREMKCADCSKSERVARKRHH
jgi:uncharacterized protein YlaI